MWQVMHQYTVLSILFVQIVSYLNCLQNKIMKTVLSFHGYTNVNVTGDKGHIRKFIWVWEFENQTKFSIKYSVNSLVNAALEQQKHPQKCIRIVLLFAWNPFSTGFSLDPLGA